MMMLMILRTTCMHLKEFILLWRMSERYFILEPELKLDIWIWILDLHPEVFIIHMFLIPTQAGS
jgi:hypothetical protein